MNWTLFKQLLSSRLIMGSASFPSPAVLKQCIEVSGAEVITVSISRQVPCSNKKYDFWDIIKESGCFLLPNTAGCRNATDAVAMAQMAREIFSTDWIKLEIIGDDYNLHPDSCELVIAATKLIDQGFNVLPYCTDDLVVCKKLVECGCEVLMPGVAPIGSGRGILNSYNLQILRNRFQYVKLIADAGIGRPSDATKIMELGFDAILLNSAIAYAIDPVNMALAFNKAVEAGFLAYNAGIMPKKEFASASTPLTDTPFWHYRSTS